MKMETLEIRYLGPQHLVHFYPLHLEVQEISETHQDGLCLKVFNCLKITLSWEESQFKRE